MTALRHTVIFFLLQFFASELTYSTPLVLHGLLFQLLEDVWETCFTEHLQLLGLIHHWTRCFMSCHFKVHNFFWSSVKCVSMCWVHGIQSQPLSKLFECSDLSWPIILHKVVDDNKIYIYYKLTLCI